MHRRLAFSLSLALVVLSASSHALTIVQWNFNSKNPDNSSTTGTTDPSIGTGIASLVGGTTATFATGSTNDPAPSDNSGWNTTTYAAQGAQSGQRGVQFLMPTVGYKDLVFSFDLRHSNTSSRYVEVQYTLDGSTWTTAGLSGNVFMADAGDKWFNGRTVDFTGIAGANDNPNFGVRVVAIFAPGTNGYLASNPTSTYASTGTLRYDMVTLTGQPVPEPAGLIALALGAAGLLARKRRK